MTLSTPAQLAAFVRASDAYVARHRTAHSGEPVVTRDAGEIVVYLPDGGVRIGLAVGDGAQNCSNPAATGVLGRSGVSDGVSPRTERDGAVAGSCAVARAS